MRPVGDIVPHKMIVSYPVWDDVRINGSAVRQQGVSAPSFAVLTGGIYTYQFPAGSKKDVFFEVQMPHGYREGTDLHPHVHFSPQGADVGTVTWELEYTIANINGTFPASVTDPKTYTVPLGGENLKHILMAFDPIPGRPGNVPFLLSTMLVCRLSRRGDTDSNGAAMSFIEFDFHFEIDTMGSQGVFNKFLP